MQACVHSYTTNAAALLELLWAAHTRLPLEKIRGDMGRDSWASGADTGLCLVSVPAVSEILFWVVLLFYHSLKWMSLLSLNVKIL